MFVPSLTLPWVILFPSENKSIFSSFNIYRHDGHHLVRTNKLNFLQFVCHFFFFKDIQCIHSLTRFLEFPYVSRLVNSPHSVPHESVNFTCWFPNHFRAVLPTGRLPMPINVRLCSGMPLQCPRLIFMSPLPHPSCVSRLSASNG